MSLFAPGYFWDQRKVYSYMYNDTMASVMDLSEEDIKKRIDIAKKVLKASDLATGGLLSPRLDDDMYKTIVVYIKMLRLVKNNQTVYIPEPCTRMGMASYKFKIKSVKN